MRWEFFLYTCISIYFLLLFSFTSFSFGYASKGTFGTTRTRRRKSWRGRGALSARNCCILFFGERENKSQSKCEKRNAKWDNKVLNQLKMETRDRKTGWTNGRIGRGGWGWPRELLNWVDFVINNENFNQLVNEIPNRKCKPKMWINKMTKWRRKKDN